MTKGKYVYFFGEGVAEGRADMKNLLGGKGANLAEMTNLGISVPPGFTITTEVCTYYYKYNKQYPKGFKEDVEKYLSRVEKIMGKKFGDPNDPLLLSVRSGARVSMPGMMDTVLNLGLNDVTVQGLIAKTNNKRFGFDSYRRFIQMYSNVVMGMKGEHLEHILEGLKKKKAIKLDTDLNAEDLESLIPVYKAKVKEVTGKEFPDSPMDQMWGGIDAVFNSWNVERAIIYRKLHNIPEDWGTAVNLMSMVFGNMGENSGTGVAFTRDPATGENKFYGEFLKNAQGEDVVAGIRTPQKIDQLEKAFPKCYKELVDIYNKLEKHYKDMQDIEFTIQEGKLWMLQCRTGKRTGFASFRIAVDMVEEGLISKEQAILRVEPEQLNQLLRPIFDIQNKNIALNENRVLAKGLNAGPGAATGKIVFSAEDAINWKKRGEKVILVRIETSPEDIGGMDASEGILTARGGMTSHAALVARQMGKVCVAGCDELEIDYKNKKLSVKSKVLKEGDYISIDGTTGEVIEGEVKTIPSEVLQVLIYKTMKPDESEIYRKYLKLMKWADEVRKLKIRTNADQGNQSEIARAFGAEGIGLCRTEHMFFEGNRIDAVREMILADDIEGRKKALAKLLPMQKGDFKEIFKAMNGYPVTIRLLDPPLHEFLPHTDNEIQLLAKQMGVSFDHLKAKREHLHEFNPMLGHRGCRLGILYPEITEMQTRAIIEAACELKKSSITVEPEIMVPLVGHVKELEAQREVIDRVCKEVFKEQKITVDYLVGTMIELPRAAITADKIAEQAEFFSFGTNDLTQTAFGMSRDDAGKYLPFYLENELLKSNPFAVLDIEGVGELVKIGIQKGRSTKPNLKVGICGEHGGEASSVEFCHSVNMNYVSCSPYRVPIARLAAAQAKLKEK
ncbi:MAG: pyruvate, phosphate dikinase [Spirochaetota bacterium]|nr:pyruvate, phosphate dikinase [Spirochaetota bacterium]